MSKILNKTELDNLPISERNIFDDNVYKKMSEDGIKEALYGDKAKNFMLDKWQAKLDTESSYSKGHEELIIYGQQTADGYDVYVCTDEHGNGRIDMNDDLYYYVDGEAFMERVLDILNTGGSVWIDSYIANDIDTEIDAAFEIAYEEWYEEKFEEYQNKLINDGYELKKD